MTGERRTNNVARLANLPDECGHPSYTENIGRRRSTANKAYEEDEERAQADKQNAAPSCF